MKRLFGKKLTEPSDYSAAIELNAGETELSPGLRNLYSPQATATKTRIRDIVDALLDNGTLTEDAAAEIRTEHETAGTDFEQLLADRGIEDDAILKAKATLYGYDFKEITPEQVDRKAFGARCAVGLVEGGCCNAENVETLRAFRDHCEVLVSVGDCATMGGIPALRNLVPLRECLDEAYVSGPSTVNPGGRVPDDPELPLLLDRVYPCHEVVLIDYDLPGCPPSADALWAALQALLSGEDPVLPYALLKYD